MKPTLHELLSHLDEITAHLPAEDAARLRRLSDAILPAAWVYLHTRVVTHELHLAGERGDTFRAADRARRAAHISFVDSIRIGVRNAWQLSRKPLPRELAVLVGDGEDDALRARVAEAAMAHLEDQLPDGPAGPASPLDPAQALGVLREALGVLSAGDEPPAVPAPTLEAALEQLRRW